MGGVESVKVDFATVLVALAGLAVIVFGIVIIAAVLSSRVESRRESREWDSAKKHADWWEHVAENDELSPFERDVARAKRKKLVSRWSRV